MVDACVFNLSQLGELTVKLDKDFTLMHTDIPWNEMRGLRNKIVHDYEGVNLKLVWEIVSEDLPELKEKLKKEEEDLNATKIIQEVVDEETLEKSISVFSCSPAYAFMFIDAIAKAGVKIGLDYKTSLRLASQAVKGSSSIVLVNDEDIDSLVASLCTKGGMTIEGVESLNSDNFYDIVGNAIIKASDKQRKLK